MSTGLDDRSEMIVKELVALPDSAEPNEWPFRRLITQTEVNGKLWGKLCLLARGRISANEKPVNSVMLLIEAVNGMRRQNGWWDVETAVVMLDQAKTEASELSDNAGKKRALELWRYNAALVYHIAGKFQKAAEFHVEAAEAANAVGDKKAEANALYLGAVAFLNEELTKVPKDKETVQASFEDLKELAGNYLKLLGASPEDVRWRANIHCTVVVFEYIVVGPGLCFEALAVLDRLPDDLKPAFAPARIALEAIYYLSTDDLVEALRVAKTMPADARIDWRPAAMFVEAQVNEELFNVDAWRQKMQEIVDLSQTQCGGHTFIAEAKRQLGIEE